MKISIGMATRMRPHNMDRVWRSAVDTATNKTDLNIWFGIDDDDTAALNHAEAMHKSCAAVNYVSWPRTFMSDSANKACLACDGEIIMLAADDIVFRTPNWDNIVREAFEAIPDKIAFVFGHDGIAGQNFGTHGFVHKNWISVLGYAVPPIFTIDYADSWINEIADRVGRKRYVPIFVEHLHHAAGKAPTDQPVIERYAKYKREDNTRMFSDTEGQRISDAQKLADFIASYK